jgi:hypothetical protein
MLYMVMTSKVCEDWQIAYAKDTFVLGVAELE